MRKMSNKGFTLIELLAVITIMGILMMVAIPAVSRTIENSRRDTFMNLGKTYINAVRNAVLADELNCTGIMETGGSSETRTVAATPTGNEYVYYFGIDSGRTAGTAFVSEDVNYTKSLLESGGDSSWGGAKVAGYVKWKKTETTVGGSNTVQTTYSIKLTDTGNHGINAEQPESDLTRNDVLSSGASFATKPTLNQPSPASGEAQLIKCVVR